MKMNKLVALLAALCILCGALPMMSLTASAAEITLTDSYKSVVTGWVFGLDNWNTTRGANKIICYNSDYGKTTTGTNEWGIEIAINEYGFVTAIEDHVGNMEIPENGSVISAHIDNTVLPAAVEKGSIKVGDQLLPSKAGGSQYYVFRVNNHDKLLGKASSSDVNDKTFAVPYTKLYGGSFEKAFTLGGSGVRTGTNEWNNDVLVKITGDNGDGTYSGYIVKFGGNNIEVPEGYFAVCLPGQTMHDTGEYAYNYSYLVQQYTPAGSVVNFSNKNQEAYFRYDAAAAKRAALLMAGKTDATVTDVYAYSAKTIVDDAKANYELVDVDRMQVLADNMAAIADKVQTLSTNDELRPYMATLYQNYEELSVLEFEKRPVEMRAVWIRPLPNDRVERTAEELDAMLEAQVKEQVDLGYNQIFIEAFYNSCTIFPVPETAGYKDLYYSQNPYLVPTNMTCGSAGLNGKNSKLTEPYDMLQRFIDICREYGVEPHIWWEVFYVGYTRTDPNVKDALFEYSVANQIIQSLDKGETTYKNWINQAHTGSYYYGAETDGAHQYFLSPASDNVRTFLLKTFEYIFKTYDAESFQLDYIRYPHTTAGKCFGYDAGTLWKFEQSDLYDPDTHTEDYLKTYEGFYDEAWVQFRANFVTTFIEEVRSKIKEVNPSYYLTSSPGADPVDSKKNLMQDIEYWLSHDLIDVLYPMAYGENVPGMVAPGLVANNPKHFVCVGSSAGYNSDAYEMRWLKEIRDAGADGIAGFGTIDSWKSYAWSEDAVTPTGNATKAATVYFNDVLLARAVQMVKLGDLDEADYNTVKAAVAEATFALRVYGIESAEAYAAIEAAQAVADTFNGNVNTAMTKDIDYIWKIWLNSHDTAKANNALASMDTTLAIDEYLLPDLGDSYVFNPMTDTVYVTADGAVISGEAPENLTFILANDVTELEFNGVTFPTNVMEVSSELTVYLSGVNRFNGNLPADITYIGTGEIYNGDELVMCKGDVDGEGKLTSDDLRIIMQYNVKATDLTDEQILIGDVNGDGKVNTIDTRSLLNKLVWDL